MPTLTGIFILGELEGPVADEIQAIIAHYDPKLAKARRPHITLAGSSGMGPIAAGTPIWELNSKLEQITQTTPPLSLTLEPAHRFIPTDIVVLPIDPHGAIRTLHDRIATSGLHAAAPRFTFSPHVTLNLYRTLTPDALRELMRVRITEPVILDTLRVYLTREPRPARLLLELPLNGRS